MLTRSILCSLLFLIIFETTSYAQVAPAAPEVSRIAPESTPISALLSRRQDLDLSDEQVQTLENLRNQLQRNMLRQRAAIQIAELELLDLISNPAFDQTKVKAKLGEIESARVQLRFELTAVTRQARDVLSPTQRRRSEPLLVTLPLEPAPLDAAIERHVQSVIREQLRDQKVVEIETTQAIIDRLMRIGQLLLLIGGIPLAILSFFGVKKLTNLTAVLRLTQKQLGEARAQVKATQDHADALMAQQQSIRQTAGDLELQYRKIQDSASKAVAEISAIQMQVTEEGAKATLAIRTTTAEALKTLPQATTPVTAKADAKSAWPHDGSILTIPVVVHVVYSTDTQNVSDKQVKSQIDALNLDFRAKNANIGDVPAPFKDLVGDARIEFSLASEDPLGKPTTGITRTHTHREEFGTDADVASPKRGGVKAWEPERYLNIWVCRLGSGLLSASQRPGDAKEWDGVIIHSAAFGTLGTAAAPFNKGRTATSGIAKYLDLRNLWSEDCKDSDLVPDTPPQKGPNFGRPTFPHVSCNNGPHGDMFMNFMDYVDDDVMCMFTKGQVQRMQATLLGPRRQLGRSSWGG